MPFRTLFENELEERAIDGWGEARGYGDTGAAAWNGFYMAVAVNEQSLEIVGDLNGVHW